MAQVVQEIDQDGATTLQFTNNIKYIKQISEQDVLFYVIQK